MRKRTWDLINKIATYTFIFSILSMISEFKSSNDFINFLKEKGEQIKNVLELIGSIIDLILTPYRFLTDMVFNWMPIEIPAEWHDPLVVGAFVALIPLNEIRYYKRNIDKATLAYDEIYPEFIDRIFRSIHINRHKNIEVSGEIQSLLNQIFPLLTYKIIVNVRKYCSLLISSFDIYEIHGYRIECTQMLYNYEKKIKRKVKDQLEIIATREKFLLYSRRKGLVAITILVLLVCDAFYSNLELKQILSILYRSFLAMLSLGTLGLLGLLPIFIDPIMLWFRVKLGRARKLKW